MSNPSAADLTSIFELMSTAQRCDLRLRAMISGGEVTATYYSPRGQEAIAAAFGVLLRPDDYLVATYRGLHDHIAKGVDLTALFAEYFGRGDGLCGGNGGPMHLSQPDVGLMMTTGIVGGGLPVANGLALASQLLGDGRVTVVSFGDGATNVGAFHEALNLAALWSLPIVFLCQNNRYAEHTAFRAGTSVDRVSDRAASYLMPGETVDGNDPLAVYAVAAAAIERARSGGGPTLVEALTYRFHGHVLGDAMDYMDAAERQAAIDADPLPRFRAWLAQSGHVDSAILDDLETAIDTRIDEAVRNALASPPRTFDALCDDVYASAERG
jgi:acetoin:2,6-dichlorophenolindophenol oxidoreductase subunit alpha